MTQDSVEPGLYEAVYGPEVKVKEVPVAYDFGPLIATLREAKTNLHLLNMDPLRARACVDEVIEALENPNTLRTVPKGPEDILLDGEAMDRLRAAYGRGAMVEMAWGEPPVVVTGAGTRVPLREAMKLVERKETHDA